MGGAALETVGIDERGLSADRRQALMDPETGTVLSAKRPKRWGDLVNMTAKVVDYGGADEPLVRIHMPGAAGS